MDEKVYFITKNILQLVNRDNVLSLLFGTERLWAFPVTSLPNVILSVCIIFILSGQDANSNNNSSSTLTKKTRYTLGIMLLNNEHLIFCLKAILCSRVSLVAQLVKNLPAMWETWV